MEAPHYLCRLWPPPFAAAVPFAAAGRPALGAPSTAHLPKLLQDLLHRGRSSSAKVGLVQPRLQVRGHAIQLRTPHDPAAVQAAPLKYAHEPYLRLQPAAHQRPQQVGNLLVSWSGMLPCARTCARAACSAGRSRPGQAPPCSRCCWEPGRCSLLHSSPSAVRRPSSPSAAAQSPGMGWSGGPCRPGSEVPSGPGCTP